ncbi:hypothetical protein [Nocardia miyunensis]|uniref:hypothetical protein n=1 Tax=Nocardia miyunensis TaxID=282684 RepID=UPI001C3FE4B2|nr:hypothetical protein [Nocardia miyunensis]
MLDEVTRRLEAAAAVESTLVGRLTSILEEAITCVEDYPSLTRFEASICYETSRHPDLSAVRARRRESESELYFTLVDDAIATGELPSNVDRQVLVDVLLAISLGLTHLSATSSGERHRAAVRAF